LKLKSEDWIETCDDKRVDGDPVVLVLLVGVSAAQPQAGQEGPEEVGDETNDDERRCAAQVA
jgi:hypothetical protein